MIHIANPTRMGVVEKCSVENCIVPKLRTQATPIDFASRCKKNAPALSGAGLEGFVFCGECTDLQEIKVKQQVQVASTRRNTVGWQKLCSVILDPYGIESFWFWLERIGIKD